MWRRVVALVLAVAGPGCEEAETSSGSGGAGGSGGSGGMEDGGNASSTTTSAGGEGGAGPTCGDVEVLGAQTPNESEACVACVDAACCNERAECGDEPDCRALVDCVSACDGLVDYACIFACRDEHPEGVVAIGDMAVCRNTACNQQCGAVQCVGALTWEAPKAPTRTTTFGFNRNTGAPLANAMVRACPRDDDECVAPIATATTDAQGRVELELPTSADGYNAYLEISGSQTPTALIYYFAANPEATFSAPHVTLVVPDQAMGEMVSAALDFELDPLRGAVATVAIDCSDTGHQGVSIELGAADGASVATYFDGVAPDPAATSTGPNGLHAVFNVPAGMTSVTGTYEGAPWGSVEVAVRPGALTWFFLSPTP